MTVDWIGQASRVGTRLNSGENQGDVVFADFAGCGSELVAGGVKVRMGPRESGAQCEDALVEGAGAGLDQAVGVQGEDGPWAEPDPRLPVPGGGYPEGLSAGHADDVGGGVGHGQYGRKMAGRRYVACLAGGIDDGVRAGGEGVLGSASAVRLSCRMTSAGGRSRSASV